MTSTGHLSLQRSPSGASQHIQRLGSHSPNSIPSSPTPVHLSSSAIFKRDIEPIIPPSPPFHQDPHQIPHAKSTEQLEHGVPSVLDSAASLLATINDANNTSNIAVVTPASASSPAGTFESILAQSPNSGFASLIGSFRSCSPNPLGLRVAPGGPGVAGSIPLLNIPPPMTTTIQGTATGSASSPSNSAALSPPFLQSCAPLPNLSTIPPVHNNSLPTLNGAMLNSVTGNPPPPAIVTPLSSDDEGLKQSLGNAENEIGSSEESSPTTETACLTSANAQEPTTGSTPSQSGATTGQTRISNPASASILTTTQPHSQRVNFMPTIMMSSLSTSGLGSGPSASATQHLALSHPPSPMHTATKRLSIMSYSDLLTSTPASSMDLPPHIPALANAHAHAQAHGQGLLTPTSTHSASYPLGFNFGGSMRHVSGSTTASAPLSRINMTNSATTSLRGFAIGAHSGVGKRDSIAAVGVPVPPLDDDGGEWEREGLGRGLEERFEALIGTQSQPQPQPQPVVMRT